MTPNEKNYCSYGTKSNISCNNKKIIFKDFNPIDQVQDIETFSNFTLNSKGLIITRKFSLIPSLNAEETQNLDLLKKKKLQLKTAKNSFEQSKLKAEIKNLSKKITTARRKIYIDIKKQFEAIISLKNDYVKILTEYALAGHLEEFRGTNNTNIDAYNIFNFLRLKEIDSNAITDSENRVTFIKFKTKVCAAEEAYICVRNWIIRKENLRIILRELINKIGTNKKFTLSFLRGIRFEKADLDDIVSFLNIDIFQNRQNISLEFLTNYIYQIRNIFFSLNDFNVSKLNSPETLQQKEFNKTIYNFLNFDPTTFYISIANGFKKGNQKSPVSEEQLLNYLLEDYFRKINTITGYLAKRILALKKRVFKLQFKSEKTDRISHQINSLNKLTKKLFSILPSFDFFTFADFKILRKKVLEPLKSDLMTYINGLNRDYLFGFINIAFKKEINEFLSADNIFVLNRIYKPFFLPISILNISMDGLQEYIIVKLQYKVRELLKEFFITDQFMNLFKEGFSKIYHNFDNLINIPIFKRYSLNLINPAVFDKNYDNLQFSIGFTVKESNRSYIWNALKDNPKLTFNDAISKRLTNSNSREFYKVRKIFEEKIQNPEFDFIENFIKFDINDKEGRMQDLLRYGIPNSPNIIFSNNKLLLCLPFELNKTNLIESNLYSYKYFSNSEIEIGIDLGIKHFAVVSVWDRKKNIEIARYFIGPSEIIDKKLIENSNLRRDTDNKIETITYPRLVWTYQNRLKQGNLSNIKLNLINLRSHQIVELQRKKNKYKQELLNKGINKNNFKDFLQWNKINNQLNLCWERVSNLNNQIVHYVNHIVTQIAIFYRAKVVKVEDLRWSRHVKRSFSGKFLAFWQIHWLHSQIQSAIALQCQINGISFKKINPRKSSRLCSRCGKEGIRKGKIFICNNCGLKLDSDLNAARNIVNEKFEPFEEKKVNLSHIYNSNLYKKNNYNCDPKRFYF